ncbi:hypothetical protein OF001_U130096 [Pseudomonas sp. OF001]|nr:hypothetical protein OF001_U130096 [Pseudomonas sp. OF001]
MRPSATPVESVGAGLRAVDAPVRLPGTFPVAVERACRPRSAVDYRCGGSAGLVRGRTGFPFNAGPSLRTLTKSKTPRTLVRGVVKLKQLSDDSG